MFDLAPGNLLQQMHFRRRLQLLRHELGRPPRFVEVGAGRGWLSEAALAEGCSGVGYDLNPEACAANGQRNATAIANGRYTVRNEPFPNGSAPSEPPTDLVFSCMVLEHMTEEAIREVIEGARCACRKGGILAAFVPAGMRYWGIEDDVAGHLRRYEREDLVELACREHLRLLYWRGLTFPISNLLRALSNRLVAGAESHKLRQSLEARTVASGQREVLFKTRFPSWARLGLNRWSLWPFDLLQRLFGHSGRSMVLYCEWDLSLADTP